MSYENLQTLCNEDANRIMEQTKQEKAVQGNLNLIINLTTIAMVAEDTVTIETET